MAESVYNVESRGLSRAGGIQGRSLRFHTLINVFVSFL